MAKKYNSSKKQDGEQKTTALSNMYDKLMAYAKVIEGSDWKMGWASTQHTWNGFPQNISGRQYTGGNSFYLMMATMANNHTVPIYATFNQIQKMNQLHYSIGLLNATMIIVLTFLDVVLFHILLFDHF